MAARTRTRRYAAGAGTDARVLAQPQVSALPHALADNRFHGRGARLLREAGVDLSMAIIPDLAAITPDVTSRSFRTLFGGDSYHERPRSREGNILCINRVAQPYAPHSPGQSGLVFVRHGPGVRLLEDTCENFHLFLNMDPKLSRSEKQIRYIGTYTKVTIVHEAVEPKEWRSLPTKGS